jgi:hypothetical protein
VVAELSSELVQSEEERLSRVSWSCDSVVRVSCSCKRLSVIGYKCTINPITNPNPVYSHLTRDSMMCINLVYDEPFYRKPIQVRFELHLK